MENLLWGERRGRPRIACRRREVEETQLVDAVKPARAPSACRGGPRQYSAGWESVLRWGTPEVRIAVVRLGAEGRDELWQIDFSIC